MASSTTSSPPSSTGRLLLPPAAYTNLKKGQKPRSQALWNRKAGGLCVIRDQLTLSQWVLLGATLQALLVLIIPLSKRATVLPVLAIATWKILQGITAVSSYRPGRTGDHVRRAKLGATMEHDVKSDGGVCLLILGARSYHPLGLFAPGFKDLGAYLEKMLHVLENNSEDYDFLGYEECIESGDYKRNALKNHYYFRNYEGLHKFAHSDLHREGWDWWNKTLKQHAHLGIFHETYHSPAGHWEAIYGNFEPSGIGATVFPYIEENGEHSWRTPMQDATKGRLKTSQGRMSRTFGNDNDHVDEPDYDE